MKVHLSKNGTLTDKRNYWLPTACGSEAPKEKLTNNLLYVECLSCGRSKHYRHAAQAMGEEQQRRGDETLLEMFDSCPASMSSQSRATRIAIAFCPSGAPDEEIAHVRGYVMQLINTRTPKASQ